MFLQHKGTINVLQNQAFNENLVNNSPLNVTVSIYKSYHDNVGTKYNLFTFLTSTEYKHRVEQVRAVKDKKQRDNIKATLPAVTVSGLFDKRNLQSKCTPTNLLCLDFDDVPDLPALFEYLTTLPFIAFVGYSVSGKGIFAIVPIQSTKNFLAHFHALERDFLTAGYQIDPACKDVTRLRGASYTERPYINHTASTYEKTATPAAAAPPTPTHTPRPKHTSSSTPADKAVQIATDAAAKKGLMFRDGSRTNYTVFVAGLLNRFGIEQNEAFYALDSVIGIGSYPDHKKRFFDVYLRYQHEHNTTHFTATYQQQPTPPTKKDAPPAAAPPAAKKVFAPFNIKPLHTIKYTKYLSDSPEFEAMCCLMLLSGNRFWQFCSPTRSGKTYAFTRLFIAVVTALHPDKKVCFINPLRTPTDQVTSENPDLNTDIAVFDHSIFTWDKGLLFLLKHIDRLNDIIIIVDEAHDLIKAADPKYKAKQIGQLYSYLKFAFKVICLSGTPFGIMEQLGYTTLKAEPTTPNKYKPEQITTTAANIPAEIIGILQKNKSKKSLIFCNRATSTSPTSAESLSKLANICNLKGDFVFSGNKLSNPNSQHLQTQKTLPDETDNLFCTAVFETGLTVERDSII